MSKAAITIDAYKLATFESVLTKNGFAYENKGELTKDCILLQVETDESNLKRLAVVVKHANSTAIKSRMN